MSADKDQARDFSLMKSADQLISAQGLVENVPAEASAEPSGLTAAAAADAGSADEAASPVGLTDTRSSRARRWTALESITVRNFKATEKATIPLGGVTILVGPNGCGNSRIEKLIRPTVKRPGSAGLHRG
jgi:hypothetical protein